MPIVDNCRMYLYSGIVSKETKLFSQCRPGIGDMIINQDIRRKQWSAAGPTNAIRCRTSGGNQSEAVSN